MIKQNGAWRAASWDDALDLVSQRLASARATAANAVFINQAELGSFPAFLDTWLAALGMPAHLAFDAEAQHAVMAANRSAFGGVAWPRYDFTAARLIVSFSADFLDNWGNSAAQQLDWGDARATLATAPLMI